MRGNRLQGDRHWGRMLARCLLCVALLVGRSVVTARSPFRRIYLTPPAVWTMCDLFITEQLLFVILIVNPRHFNTALSDPFLTANVGLGPGALCGSSVRGTEPLNRLWLPDLTTIGSGIAAAGDVRLRIRAVRASSRSAISLALACIWEHSCASAFISFASCWACDTVRA